jgi:MtN3 and saliva related transmembrane protein
MIFGEALGYAAAFLTTVAFIPQALQTVKSRNTEAISLGMYSTFTLGVICWFGYGVYRQDIAIMIANLITASMAGLILYHKIRNEGLK